MTILYRNFYWSFKNVSGNSLRQQSVWVWLYGLFPLHHRVPGHLSTELRTSTITNEVVEHNRTAQVTHYQQYDKCQLRINYPVDMFCRLFHCFTWQLQQQQYGTHLPLVVCNIFSCQLILKAGYHSSKRLDLSFPSNKYFTLNALLVE